MAEKKKGKKKGVAVQGEEDEKLTKLQKKVLHWLRDCPVQFLKCYFQDFYLLSKLLIRDVYLGSRFFPNPGSRIQTQLKKRRENLNCFLPFFVACTSLN
jgi:hypothetical protein